MNTTLNKFGEFIVQTLRDRMFDDLERYLSGSSKAPAAQKLQGQLSGFTDEQKQVLRDLVEELTTIGMHDLLFAVSDSGGEVRILVDGQDVAKLSDGLHGEIFGDEGWIVRFSKYPSQVQIEESEWARKVIAEKFGKKDDPVA